MANSVQYRSHNRNKRLPSLWRHGLLAIALLASVAVGAYAAVSISGKPGDALAPGETPIVEEPIAALPDPNTAPMPGPITEDLPDLLAGDVDPNANPTEGLAGGETGEGTPVTAPPGSKTITLNGKAIGASKTLPVAPIPGLSRMTQFGPVPGPNGTLTPLSAYKRPFTLPAGKTPVSIVIGGLGFDSDVTSRAIRDLPPNVTLAFAAAAPNVQNWIDQARSAGHEVLLEVPMESFDFNAAEPGASSALKTGVGGAVNVASLERMMSRRHGYFGITNYNGDKFVLDSQASFPVLSYLKDAGLGFVFDGSVDAGPLNAQANAAGAKLSTARRMIDVDSQSQDFILGELNALLGDAKSGSAIGMGFAFPDTIEAVRNWSATLDERGYVLAPASATFR